MSATTAIPQAYAGRSKVEPFYRRGLRRQIDDNAKYRHVKCLNRGDQSTQRKCRIGERPHHQDHGVGRGERQLRIDRASGIAADFTIWTTGDTYVGSCRKNTAVA